MTVGANVTSAVKRNTGNAKQLEGEVKKNSGKAASKLKAVSKKLGKSEHHAKFKMFKFPLLGGFFGPLLAIVIIAALIEDLED